MAAIEPLRINKGTPVSSPTKSSALGRPLSEINPAERRRNSPSFNQTTRKSFLDSSPLETSPFASKFNLSPFSSNSPLAYWQSKDPGSPTRQNHENRDPRESSPSSAKRPSVENLKKASRVKNSSIFAREQKLEYDPASTTALDRPLAAGRPFATNLPTGLWGKKSEALKSSPNSPTKETAVPFTAPQEIKEVQHQASPSKSSLSRNSRYDNASDENGVLSEEEDISSRQLPSGKSLRRHAKSVTFDTAPPEINEYEMTTPDPSSVASGSRENSYESTEEEDIDGSFSYRPHEDHDDSFDASLEDTDKTPVVLPEEWRFMSPDNANDALASTFEDPFDMRKSPGLSIEPIPLNLRPSPSRTDSIGSNGERRPLPPLPSALTIQSNKRSSSPGSLQAMAERVASSSRTLPNTPKAALVSKSELQGLGAASMSLEERLRLMMLQQDDDKTSVTKSAAEEQRERRMRRAGSSPDRSLGSKSDFMIHEDEDEYPELDIQIPSMISRESILRKVKDQAMNDGFRGSPTPSTRSSPERQMTLPVDPDVPIPSLEDRLPFSVAEDGMMIKQEDEDSGFDLNAIPEAHIAVPQLTSTTSEESLRNNDDSGSYYSADLQEETHQDEAPPTPKASAQDYRFVPEQKSSGVSLPQFSTMIGVSDFSSSFSQYTSSTNPNARTAYEPTMDISYSRGLDYKLSTQVPVAPVEIVATDPSAKSDSDRESTPESIIHRPVYSSDEDNEMLAPVIPESSASVRAPGGLKTRPSLAPADVNTMAEVRRKVSGERPAIPPVPERHRNRPSVILEQDSFVADLGDGSPTKPTKRKSSLLTLDVPVDMDASLSMGIDKEFDRVMESSKKGYLMRQNTKLIVASSDTKGPASGTSTDMPPPSRSTRSAGNSPIKGSATWTTEPWNGRIRRKSIRQSGGGAMMKLGVAPPLPGSMSNVSCDVQEPQDAAAEEGDDFEDGQERGRLFVKVVGVKDLEMALPQSERSYFCLTLDNGLHCVTTSWLELGRNAPIGQEFELVVLNDLEFQLTLQTKIEEPKPIHPVLSPTKIQKPKTSAFSRVFASPKKRKEQELRLQEAENVARQRALDAGRPKSPSAWDLLHKIVGKDGSFARAYVSLKDHETEAYGRPFTVDIPCFNEWATEEVRHVNSAKSGRSIIGGMQRKAPYKIAKLELQLLYVPKPKEATDEDMPKSMNACVREIQDAERAADHVYEGHLSQQGGDCPYWRRRFFRLEGSKLTAYHESTRQPRATINLAKATRLIDDKSSLTQKEVSGKGGARRRSAFAQEEEGYMFVEEGFRMRFANGEVIDFYADKTADKEGWMKVLAEVVGKESTKNNKSWTAIVLKRERALAARALKNGPVTAPSSPTKASTVQSPTASSYNRAFAQPPPRPNSSLAQQPPRPSSGLDKPLPHPSAPIAKKMTPAERREKARTMLF